MIDTPDRQHPGCAGCDADEVTHRATLKGGHYNPGATGDATKVNLVRGMPLPLCPACAGTLQRRLSTKGWMAQFVGALVGLAGAALTVWLFGIEVRAGGGRLLLLAIPFLVFYLVGAALGRSLGYYLVEKPWLVHTYPWKQFRANGHRAFLRVEAPPAPLPPSGINEGDTP